jgi:chromosome segregation ATPase
MRARLTTLSLDSSLRSAPPEIRADTLTPMTNGEGEGIRGRVTKQGEEALGKLAQDLLENPLINSAIARAFEAREKAVQAQEVAMGALNIPSAADLERLTRRLRSVSQRLEGIEDGVDRLDERLGSLSAVAGLEARLGAIDESVTALTREIAALREAMPDAARPVPREQERFDVESDAAKPGPRARKAKATS